MGGDYRPFKITAELADGRVATTDGHLPIDSIMSYAWMKLNKPEELYTNNPDAMTIEEMIRPDLPLELRERDGEWYWSASFAVYEDREEWLAYWHKRFDKEFEKYLGGRKKTFSPQSGKYKSYRMPLPGDLTERIAWYCYGNPKETLQLLIDASITHIGKKRSQGFGLIKKWAVEEIDTDYCTFGPEHELMRSILPLYDSDVKSFVIRNCGIRPPYWHKDNNFRCMVPIRQGVKQNGN